MLKYIYIHGLLSVYDSYCLLFRQARVLHLKVLTELRISTLDLGFQEDANCHCRYGFRALQGLETPKTDSTVLMVEAPILMGSWGMSLLDSAGA